MESGSVFNLQRYCLHDGPGIRTTVFLKGCPLRCAWCHNPESLSHRRELVVAEDRCLACGECRTACPFGREQAGQGALPPRIDSCILCGACVEACPTTARQLIGRTLTVEEVLAEVVRDRIFYDDSGGGVTVSGGEPLMQPRFVQALLGGLRELGIHTALDTSGYGCTEHLLGAAQHAGLVLYDVKAFDDSRHRTLTGVSNRSILANLTALAAVHPNVWIRIPVVPGLNDDAADLARLADFVAGLRTIRRVDLLPFHQAGLHKYERLGLVHGAHGVPVPSPQVLELIAGLFHARGLSARIAN